MVVLDCPRCRGETLLPEVGEGVTCRWCGWHGPAAGWLFARHPARVQKAALEELRPIAHLLRTLGVGQTVTAFIYFALFLGFGDVMANLRESPTAALVLGIGVVLLVSGVLLIAGGVAVRRGWNRLLAVTAAWLALTSPLVLGIPIGIWALLKLNRPEGRAAFRQPTGSPAE